MIVECSIMLQYIESNSSKIMLCPCYREFYKWVAKSKNKDKGIEYKWVCRFTNVLPRYIIFKDLFALPSCKHPLLSFYGLQNEISIVWVVCNFLSWIKYKYFLKWFNSFDPTRDISLVKNDKICTLYYIFGLCLWTTFKILPQLEVMFLSFVIKCAQ